MNSDAKQKREQQLKAAALELKRIENATPAFIETARFYPEPSGERSVIVMESNPGMTDKRSAFLRWLVPARKGARRIRLDALGTFVAQRITGRIPTRRIMHEMHEHFGGNPEEIREACLVFLRSLAQRGAVCMLEKDDP